ncbi:MAG TPA: copper ion binding protein [Ktedonobacteraceae bacterium]
MNNEVQEIRISVPDMSCEHCVRTIDSALGTMAGVKSVHSDLQTKSVYLRYDPKYVSTQQIEATLDDAGYTVAKK